jgi:hypothetical protein
MRFAHTQLLKQHTMGSYVDDKTVPGGYNVRTTPVLESGLDADDQGIDRVAEKKLVRKIDFTVLPLGEYGIFYLLELQLTYIVTLVYWVSFLDRSNIANARTAGIEASLGLTGYDFNIGACLYYVVYLVCEPFAGLSIKKYGFILLPLS